MKLHRFSDIAVEARPAILDQFEVQVEQIVPGVRLAERAFDVPGRGRQTAVAVSASGELVVIEIARHELKHLPEDLARRLAWFEENRSILRRLFPDHGLDPSRPFQVILLAPGYGASFGNTVAASTAARFQFIRYRLIESPSMGVGFLLDPPDPDAAFPPIGPRSSETEPPDDRPENPEPDPLAGGPGRTRNPGELLERAEHWITRLNPDIEKREDSGSIRFLLGDQTLAVLTPHPDHITVKAGDHESTNVHDTHELNQSLDLVINRYFNLVNPEARPGFQLTRADILTEGELAAFFDSGPDTPG